MEKQNILTVPHKVLYVPLNYMNTNDEVMTVPDNIQRIASEDAITHTDRLRDEMSANKLCRGVSSEFIEDALQRGSFLLYIVKSKSPRTIEGIVIVQEKDDALYIDLICGSNKYVGVGTYLIDQVKVIASNMGKSKLTLKSLTDSVGFYLKRGFECDELCKMKMVLKGGKRTRSVRRHRRRLRRTKGRKIL